MENISNEKVFNVCLKQDHNTDNNKVRERQSIDIIKCSNKHERFILKYIYKRMDTS